MFLLAKDICTDPGMKGIWKTIGNVLTVFKIVIPLLIIIFGMIDLGKAVVASKDDEVKKAIKQLAFRAVAGVIIFFVPTLVSFVFSLVAVNGDNPDADNNCVTCITSPSSC